MSASTVAEVLADLGVTRWRFLSREYTPDTAPVYMLDHFKSWPCRRNQDQLLDTVDGSLILTILERDGAS